MDRTARPEDPRLEALLDERDHLLIEISLAADAEAPDADAIDALHRRLAMLEQQIARR